MRFPLDAGYRITTELNIFRVSTVFVTRAVFAFLRPSKWLSLVPSMPQLQGRKLLFGWRRTLAESRYAGSIAASFTSCSGIAKCGFKFGVTNRTVFDSSVVVWRPSASVSGYQLKHYFRMSQFSMHTMRGKKFKVFWSVISWVVINVVDSLFFSKVAPNHFLHYKSVFKDITLGIAKRVLPHFNSPVFASFNSARWFSHSLHYNTGKVMGI